ncbi:MAG TPA: hypothetical protein VEG44_01720 [Candidatus Acidoferrales bacterium]|nr:hypothetical protein [Candidatus Acidoferrales bacterium]
MLALVPGIGPVAAAIVIVLAGTPLSALPATTVPLLWTIALATLF